MQIGVRKSAELMNVSEETVYRWIKGNKLPVFKINEQYHINRAELLEWATAHRVNVSTEIFSDLDRDKTPIPSLAQALQAGGIHYRVEGKDKESALKSAIDLMALPKEVDRTFLLHVLMARESLGSTGIGEGVAIPHVRNPIVMHIPQPMVMLCFMENAIEFGALDGKPVHTVFMIVSPTISSHLSLLSKLSFALRHPSFAGVIARQGNRAEIAGCATQIDDLILHRSSGGTVSGAERT
jgi:PTS system nitrogen regulatory IIA component